MVNNKQNNICLLCAAYIERMYPRLNLAAVFSVNQTHMFWSYGVEMCVCVCVCVCVCGCGCGCVCVCVCEMFAFVVFPSCIAFLHLSIAINENFRLRI